MNEITSLIAKATGVELTIPDAVDKLEVEMLKLEQAQCPVYHHFSPGLYIREVNLPAGIIAVGHRQRKEHLNIFLKGRVSIVNDDGEVTEMQAPMLFTGKPGRKCGYIHEDTVWLNIYPTEERDVEILEKTFLDKSQNWQDAQTEQLARVIDRDDYKKVLAEYGYTEERVRAESENLEDQIPFPNGSYPVGIFDSGIQGRGLFATANIKAGDIIAPTRIKDKRTPAGRYTNHALNPNATMEMFGDTVYLVALKDITGCCGGVTGEEITVNYRDVLKFKFSEGESSCQE